MIHHHRDYVDPQWPKEGQQATDDYADAKWQQEQAHRRPVVSDSFIRGALVATIIMVPLWTLALVLIDWLFS